MSPLIKELNQRFDGVTNVAIARRSELTNYQVGRLLAGALPSPTYLDLTRLLVAAGLSPNDGARIVGLYTPGDDKSVLGASSAINEDERELLHELRGMTLSAEQRELLFTLLTATIAAFKKQV